MPAVGVTALVMAVIATMAPTVATAQPTTTADPVPVQLLSVTDFHGQLEPVGRVRDAGGKLIPAGGAAYLTTHLDRLREGHENSLFFSNGDNFSGFDEYTEKHNDESTIEFLNHVGLDFANVGNHELDVSTDFLISHMEKGKCYQVVGVDSCFRDSTGRPFHGADFDHLSGNVTAVDTSRTIIPGKPLPGVHVERVQTDRGKPVSVAFINLVLPALDVLRNGGGHNLSYHPDLRTLPVADTANALAQDLRARGLETIIANVHVGAIHRDGGYDECRSPHGELIDLNEQLDPEIDAVIGGHTHHTMNCALDDPAGNTRPVVQAAMDGRVINEINLRIDPGTGDVLRDATTSTNHAVTRDVAPDPSVAAMTRYWMDKVSETDGTPIGTITSDVTDHRDRSGESSLGNLVADGLASAGGKNGTDAVDLALVNTGERRYGSDLLRDGEVDFGEAWDTVPERDPLFSVEVSGAQLDQVLEAQWQQTPTGEVAFSPLAVSSGVRYSYDDSRPVGERVDTDTIRIDGEPISPDSRYRVITLPPTLFSTNSPFAEAFRGFSDPVRHSRAREAFRWYVRDTSPVAPPARDRVAVAAPQG